MDFKIGIQRKKKKEKKKMKKVKGVHRFARKESQSFNIVVRFNNEM